MRKNTKLEIMQAAKKLFNMHGYHTVSTQNIADAMGISKGNLTYHFKRKEDIMEAVVKEMHSHYTKPQTPATLEELDTLFMHIQDIAKENAFYFWHYTQLAQISEGIKRIQNTVFGNSYRLFRDAFKLLNEKEILRDEEYAQQYEQIVQAVMLTCVYWTPYGGLKEDMGIKGDFIDCIWGILYPLLTENGKAQYRVLKDTITQNT